MFLHKFTTLSLMLLSSQLLLADAVTTITTKADLEGILASNKPVIIDVFATWCGPCKLLKPVFHEFAQENKDLYVCGTIDAEACEFKQDLTALGVMGFPTILVFINKKSIGKSVGFKDKKALTSTIDGIVKNAKKSLKELSKEELTVKLQDAIQSCSVEDAALIIDAGADVNAPFADSMAPLALAIFSSVPFGDRGIAMVKLLLEKGASLQPFEINGQKVPAMRELVTQMIAHAKAITEQYTKVLALIDAQPSK